MDIVTNIIQDRELSHQACSNMSDCVWMFGCAESAEDLRRVLHYVSAVIDCVQSAPWSSAGREQRDAYVADLKDMLLGVSAVFQQAALEASGVSSTCWKTDRSIAAWSVNADVAEA